MNFMSRILGLLRLPKDDWTASVCLVVRFDRSLQQFRIRDANPTRKWFSMREEKQFRGTLLERSAYAASIAKLSVAR